MDRQIRVLLFLLIILCSFMSCNNERCKSNDIYCLYFGKKFDIKIHGPCYDRYPIDGDESANVFEVIDSDNNTLLRSDSIIYEGTRIDYVAGDSVYLTKYAMSKNVVLSDYKIIHSGSIIVFLRNARLFGGHRLEDKKVSFEGRKDNKVYLKYDSDALKKTDTLDINCFAFSNNSVSVVGNLFTKEGVVTNITSIEFIDKSNELKFFESLSLKYVDIALDKY